MTAEPPAVERGRLGVVGDIACQVLRTSEPWDAGIDAIVVSVGSALGDLGESLARRFPDTAWESIPYHRITPERPSGSSADC
ncbi:MAG TPA: hypothetical protein VFG87_08130 [Amycolatopsis sp.]|jgi:hypothetical protein|nr:hypothetical protein [Amycolatopsis sp.]